MKIIFMGTPEFAKTILQGIYEANFEIVMVVTQPDKAVGRKKILQPSPVKSYAVKHQLPLFQPNKLKEDYQGLLSLGADIIITAAYGQMLPKGLLNEIKAVNIHASLLPKYRGGAPIQYALFDGLKETGITIMYMAKKMDAGDIIFQDKLAIEASDHLESLTEKLSYLGKQMIIDFLHHLKDGFPKGFPQDETQVTYAYALKRSDEFVSFQWPVDTIINKIRGLAPKIGATFQVENINIKVFFAKKSDIISNAQPGTVLSVKKSLIIQSLDGAVELLEIQVPGKKRQLVKDFLNGQTIFKENMILGGFHE